MKAASLRRCQGFTLLEVIVTVVIAVVALSLVLPLLSQVFLKSYEPRTQLREWSELHSAMEELVSLHTNRLEDFHVAVGPVGTDLGHGVVVAENRFTDFVDGTEQSSATHTNLLSITLQSALGERVTRFFTVPL
jgi:prepilin-type N-terminal cleavage/methylation domain-containing protein